MKQRPWIYFLLFALSGFAGLIYESIWSHYLKLFLGHAAYAQTLVLAIFMGGMALGSWLAGKLGRKWKNLLLGYAIAELLIGLFGIIFHGYFTSVTGFAFESVIPAIGQPLFVDLFKWGLASLLIFPQTILLGMTFPLMSAGILRMFPEQRGESIATLYFTNSMGAAIGVLVSGFYLVDALGLPGTVLTAGIINLALAAVVMFLSAGQGRVSQAAALTKTTSNIGLSTPGIFLVAAFITGAASFIYEVSWIRMLSMVLGSSTHSFELMLSAFILGLALGSLWIRRRIDKISNPVAFAGKVQIFMGIAALATLFLYNQSFEWMGALVKSLSTTDSAYRMFLGGGYLISTAIMLPATFCAGMTLPLFTTVLLRSSYGERAIGNIYAANTIGAIFGVMFAVHVGFEWLGLKGLVVTGAILDIGLGLYILGRLVKPVPVGWFAPLAAISLSMVLGVLLMVQFDPLKLSSAVYRNGSPTGDLKEHKIVFLEDGKTATISVSTNNYDTASIATNGKPDAALSLDPVKRTTDEATMTLAGVIPLLLKPDSETVANIGFGSGQTTHTLLASDKVKRIDTIEIERQMIEGAKVFRDRVSRAYDDERSHIYIDDAKTFFARNQRQYDIIVSEPSNPWVSGTATLFSKEFYQHVKHYLKDDSLFVQWIQLYEINIDLVMTVLTALNDEFSDYHMYYAGPNDLLILAKKKGNVPFIDQARLDAADKKIHQSINRLRIASLDDFRARWVGDKKLYSPLLRLEKYQANSDYYPILEQKSPKLRFQKKVANEISNIRTSIFPVIDALRPEVRLGNYYSISPTEEEENKHSAHIAAAMNSPLFRDGNQPISVEQMPSISTANALSKAKTECATQSQAQYWVYLMSDLAIELFPNIDVGRRVNIVKRFAPECDGPWRAELNMWHHFFKAFSVQHWPGTVEAATVVLSRTKLKMRDRETHIVFGAALMGMSLTGDHQRAVDTWQSTGHKVFASGNPPLEIKLLLANSRMQLNDKNLNESAVNVSLAED